MFVDIKYLENIKFNNCENCYECCKKPMAPLILDDFEKVYHHFPILIAKLDYLKPVMLLSNEHHCPYLVNEKCSIYDTRPPACRIYPYSPWYDKILLDLSCKGIGIYGEEIATNYKEFKNSKFYEERFENINEKLKKTINWTYSQKLIYLKKHHGIKIYKIKSQKEKFNNLVQESYKYLKNYGMV